MQVVDLAKAAVLADNHFLSAAVGRLHVIPMQLTTSFATDGYFLAFDPKHLLARFKRTGIAPKRNLLHCVAHCLFLHPYVSASVDQPLWNLACDIAAERMVIDLLDALPDEKGTLTALALRRIEQDMGCRISAERVYRRLRDGWWADTAGAWMGLFRSDSHDLWYAPAQSGDDRQGEGTGEGTDPQGGVGSMDGNADSSLSKGSPKHEGNPERGEQGNPEENPHADDEPDDVNNAPRADADPSDASTASMGARSSSESSTLGQSHAATGDLASATSNQMENEKHCANAPTQSGAGAADAKRTDSTSTTDSARGTARAEGPQWGRAAGDASTEVSASRENFELGRVKQPSMQQQQAEWRQVATSLAVNLQTLSARRGNKLAGFVDDLKDSARRRADYAAFLRQFSHPGEVMRLSDDEFDNVFYTYGLELYGNVPLIEPLEYREERRVREFVIVIDTSASVQGDIVRAFVTCTFDILKETEAFFDQVHVRILQCDAQVQTDDRITNLDELERWGRGMRVAGGGGTDFRPAFAYVDALVEQGAFHDLGGVVYFTDGFGTYPQYMPAYRTAFVFYDENRHEAPAPPWAVQIVMDNDTMEDAIGRR